MSDGYKFKRYLIESWISECKKLFFFLTKHIDDLAIFKKKKTSHLFAPFPKTPKENT